jgi:transcription initiation factor TFIID TATA-box-binding protein
MSQQEVLNLLENLGGEATVDEIRSEAKKRFPDRTLSSYITKRLQAMKRQGIVEEIEINDKSGWRIINEEAQNVLNNVTVETIDSEITELELNSEGISIRNLVGSFEIGQRLDLHALAVDIPDAEYHSETHSNLVYRSPEYDSLTVLVPASGRVTIVGAKSKKDFIEGASAFIQVLQDLGIQVERTPREMRIQNIVGTTELGREVNLRAVSVELGLENTEYDPEQFPGLIYRSPELPVILLFSSGKIVITGAKNYRQVLEASKTISNKVLMLFENE